MSLDGLKADIAEARARESGYNTVMKTLAGQALRWPKAFRGTEMPTLATVAVHEEQHFVPGVAAVC